MKRGCNSKTDRAQESHEQDAGHARELHDAFDHFTRISEQLTNSYQVLEHRVAELNSELARTRDERLQELTEKERLAKRLQSLLNAMPAGVVVIDATGSIQDCNPVAIDLLKEPLIGEMWIDVLRRAFSPRADDGQSVSLNDGRRVSISTSSLGDEPGQILLLQDVTETRALQERIDHNKRLSAMGEMAASLAHQIRTPLSSAMLYASHLTQEQLESMDRQRFADNVMTNMRHLENLVNDMLIFAKGGSAVKEKILIVDLFEDLQQSLEGQISRNDCCLDIVNELPEGYLYGNRSALSGALQNLVNNAIQACGQGVNVKVRACSSREQNGFKTIKLMVSDNGAGIPAEIQDRIFEPFYTTRSQGTGLGLAVVQAVAHAHNGTVWLESQPGQGSTFGMYLPVTQRGGMLASEGQKTEAGNSLETVTENKSSKHRSAS